MKRVHGIIHGRTIELDHETDLPSGQKVSVSVEPLEEERLPAGEGLRLSAGACADEAEEWDEFDKWYREQRKLDRPPIADDDE